MNRITPAPVRIDKDNPQWNLWFQGVDTRFNMLSGASDPTLAASPQGQHFLYKNTTLNEIRWWVNDNGTMKKSAAFT
jgi:hypothetical protein